ncbi:MAG: phospholipase D-like domain-containing protein [Chloroflexota bacterium]|nr:phospholipase D-like domain-containing protein [Chloroflexota bacterium]
MSTRFFLLILLVSAALAITTNPVPDNNITPFQAQPVSPLNDHQTFLPLISSHHPSLHITALYYDTVTRNEPDEAFRLRNASRNAIDLAGYRVSDGRRTVVFPQLTLDSHASLWCSREATAFSLVFGLMPDCEYGADTDPGVPNLSGTPLRFSNSGGQIILSDPAGSVVDVLVYENGDQDQPGWIGPALMPYSPSNAFPAEGQILYRKLSLPAAGQVSDTNTSSDWAQDPNDHLAGRRVQYPGWDLERFSRPVQITSSATFTISLGPDNLFEMVRDTLATAQESIILEVHTFKHIALAELLANKARDNVSVTLLLEGGPVGGIDDQERYVSQMIEEAGGQVWFMVSDRNDASDRYAYQHAKFAVVDERILLVSTENMGPASMPDDDKSDGTVGRRGAALATDSVELVARAREIFHADFDPVHHRDLFRWTESDPRYGAPPAGFQPDNETGGDAYQLIHSQPLVLSGSFSGQLIQAPESSLLPPEAGGILGMVAQAGQGDIVLVEQLYERVHWGSAADVPETAPNLRLQAYIDAARRGAQVRILLDSYFSYGQNAQTVGYLHQIAFDESLDLRARLGNPAGLGLHNKMVLVENDHQGWLHLGSINGSEASSKMNRELALQVRSNQGYAYLAAAFWADWQAAGGEGDR